MGLRLDIQLRNLRKCLEEVTKVYERTRLGFRRAVALTAGEAKKHTPVDTGRLRNSITFTVKGFEGRVWTPVHYAPFVEFGHKAVIVPVRAKALRFYIRGKGWVFAKRVVQGRSGKSAKWEKVGDKIRKPFFQPALEWLSRNLRSIIEKALRRR